MSSRTAVSKQDCTLGLATCVHHIAGKGEPVPEHPYPGQSWKEVRHDKTVTWLAFWKDPISQKDFKYVWLAANSTFKSDSDLAKYEKARKLKVTPSLLHAVPHVVFCCGLSAILFPMQLQFVVIMLRLAASHFPGQWSQKLHASSCMPQKVELLGHCCWQACLLCMSEGVLANLTCLMHKFTVTL